MGAIALLYFVYIFAIRKLLKQSSFQIVIPQISIFSGVGFTCLSYIFFVNCFYRLFTV